MKLIDRRSLLVGGSAAACALPVVAQATSTAQVGRVSSTICRVVPHPYIKGACIAITLFGGFIVSTYRKVRRALAQARLRVCSPNSRFRSLCSPDALENIQDIYDFGEAVFEVLSDAAQYFPISNSYGQSGSGPALDLRRYPEDVLDELIVEVDGGGYVPAALASTEQTLAGSITVSNETDTPIPLTRSVIQLIGLYPQRSGDVPREVVEVEILGPQIRMLPNAKTLFQRDFSVSHLGILGPKRIDVIVDGFRYPSKPFLLATPADINALNSGLG